MSVENRRFLRGVLVPQNNEEPCRLAFIRKDFVEKDMHKMFKDILACVVGDTKATPLRESPTVAPLVKRTGIEPVAISFGLPAFENARASFFLMAWGESRNLEDFPWNPRANSALEYLHAHKTVLRGNALLLDYERRPSDMGMHNEQPYRNFSRLSDLEDIMGPFADPVYAHRPTHY